LVHSWPRILVVIKLNIHEAKTHLSKYLDRLLQGEVIVLCRRNEPIAEIRALAPRRREPRPIGLGVGEVTVPPSFFEPLPEDVVRDFEGGGS
jgi:antitoxin (DNA-binding transcriptional repressor) of toxin-antitoxin stability system